MSIRDKILTAKSKKASARILPHLQEEILKPFPGYSTRQVKKHALELIKNVDEGASMDTLQKSVLDLLFIMLSGERKGRNYIHPSELKNACSRKVYYDLTGSPITNRSLGEITPKLKLTFDIGHLLHAYLQQKLFKAGCLLESEVDVVDEALMIGGKADGILHFKELEEDAEYVAEIKTINDFGFRQLKAEAIDYHQNQASIYAGVLRRQGRPIKGIIFIYINKNSSEIKEFLHPINEAEYKEAENKCINIVDHYKRKEEPIRVCKDSSEELACKCIYKDLCFKLK